MPRFGIPIRLPNSVLDERAALALEVEQEQRQIQSEHDHQDRFDRAGD
jgi:hypothetical protein